MYLHDIYKINKIMYRNLEYKNHFYQIHKKLKDVKVDNKLNKHNSSRHKEKKIIQISHGDNNQFKRNHKMLIIFKRTIKNLNNLKKQLNKINKNNKSKLIIINMAKFQNILFN